MGIYEKINAIVDERLEKHGLVKGGKRAEVGEHDAGTTTRADAAAEGSPLSQASANADAGDANTPPADDADTEHRSQPGRRAGRGRTGSPAS